MKVFENLDEVMNNFSTSGGFLTVKADNAVNTMTVSWGFIGFLWGKPHFIVFVRPQRYTKEIIDKADDFTLSIPFKNMKEQLSICGTKSGRDINKSDVVNFVPAKAVNSPVVQGCDAYYECRIRYVDKFDDESVPHFIKMQMYNNDLHSVYIGEIVDCY